MHDVVGLFCLRVQLIYVMALRFQTWAKQIQKALECCFITVPFICVTGSAKDCSQVDRQADIDRQLNNF